MPTGKNKVPMSKLREALTRDGFANVRTYIQSGNVIVDTELTIKQTEKRIHELIKKHIGADIVTVGRTKAQLQKVLRENPFTAGYDISRVFYVIFAAKPPAARVKELLQDDYTPEEVVIKNMHAYLYIPGSAARSKLNTNFLERKLKVSATARNNNTMTKLVEMSRER